MSCFFTHRWPKWSQPHEAEDKWGEDITVQSRTCPDCGKIAVRRVYAPGFGPVSNLSKESE